MRAAAVPTFLVLVLCSFAQQAQLLNGTMLVQPGTTLQFQGPIQWQLGGGVQVINEGRIEFLDGAVISEAAGSPVTGSGTEHAWIANNAPAVGSQPGGLGLELTSSEPIGPLEVVRGHIPYAISNGEESVARWFKFGSGMPAGLDQLIFHFDVTELNGLTATELELHDAEDPVGPWVPMLSNGGADLSLIATDLSPRMFYTAFHFDSTTKIEEIADHGIVVHPTITSGLVTIVLDRDRKVELIELFDINGKELPVDLIGPYQGREIRLDLSDQPAGPLFLRIDRMHIFKLVKA